MIIGVCTLELRVAMSNSLKYKRRIVKSIKAQLRQKFNLAIAETAANDKHKQIVLTLVSVANERSYLNSLFDQAVNFTLTIKDVQLIKDEIEIF